MADEFKVHLLNETGLAKANKVANAFADLLAVIESECPASSRSKSLAITKLQEASFWAKRAIAESPDHQVTP